MSGARVLVVDDEAFLAADLAMTLRRDGYEVMGPFPNADKAMAALERATPDAALLDVNLGRGRTSEAVAATLRERRVPFAFLTGYSRLEGLSDSFGDAPRLAKPCSREDVLEAVRGMVGAGGAASPE